MIVKKYNNRKQREKKENIKIRYQRDVKFGSALALEIIN